MTAPDRAAQRERAARAYLDAVAATDEHTTTCPTCSGGCACLGGDDLHTDEYRRGEDLRTVDPYAYRAYDRATWPTEG